MSANLRGTAQAPVILQASWIAGAPVEASAAGLGPAAPEPLPVLPAPVVAPELLSEINMIPLIDVMLVLLIVFIVTAPLLTHAVKIDLPKASSAPTDAKPETIHLTIKADGSLYWNGEAISEDALSPRMEDATRHIPQTEIHLEADAQTSHEIIARIMALSAKFGLGRIGFVSESMREPR
jgi:biopolymer transport protein ExbD